MIFFFLSSKRQVQVLDKLSCKMQQMQSETGIFLQNEYVKDKGSFALSEASSLYFGPNPSPEAQRLLEQAKELLRENERIQSEKVNILQEETDLRNRKVYLDSQNMANNVFRPTTELQRLLSETMSLSEQGKQIDQRKAQLQLYYNELKRRKEFLQNAIKMYEESQLGQSLCSPSNQSNIYKLDHDS